MVAPNWAGPHYAAVWGAAMRHLLADPEMAALLGATPRMEKLLRPLCWGLGIEASSLRPRPAPPDVSGPTTASVEPEDGGIVSSVGTATTPTAERDKPPAATRPERIFIPRFLAPA
jgi:hypothetical protein